MPVGQLLDSPTYQRGWVAWRLAQSAALGIFIAFARLFLMLLVVSPVAAEVFCFAALGKGRAESGASTVITIGLCAAALPLLVPLFYTFTIVPIVDTAKDTASLAKAFLRPAEHGHAADQATHTTACPDAPKKRP